MKQFLFFITLLILGFNDNLVAQNQSGITIKGLEGATASVALMIEKVHFHPSLGVGLSDVELISKATVNLAQEKERIVTADEITTVRIAQLTVVPPAGSGSSVTYLLYLSPKENLTIKVDKAGGVSFEGQSAPYQQFLKEYFKANQYQYLPAFGFKPSQIKNDDVIRQSDSLQELRTKKYYEFIANKKVPLAFDAFVRATTATEPYLIRMMLEEREMRRNRVARLSSDQQAKIDAFTLQNFKLFSDEALLSKSYREQLRSFILIPAIRKFPPDAANHFMLSADAIKMAYNESKSSTAAYPEQERYLLTYWLNYSVSSVNDTKAAEVLLADYQKKYPGSELGLYFEKIYNARIRLTVGEQVPVVTNLLDVGNKKVQLPQKGKPSCIIFNFNVRQHEPSLKPLEDKYSDKVNFVYVTVMPGMSFDTWKSYQQERKGAVNILAPDDAIASFAEKFAIDIRYPYLVVDKDGKLVKRWIPLDFPANAALEKEIQNSLAK